MKNFFDQSKFLDAIQERVENTIKPLKKDNREIKQDIKSIKKTLSNHITTEHKKINEKLNKILQNQKQ